MLKRCLILSLSLALVVSLSMVASGQIYNLAPLVSKTTFTPDDTATLQEIIKKDVEVISTSSQSNDVRAARERLVRLPRYPGATTEFQQVSSRLAMAELTQRYERTQDPRNRLAMTVTLVRLQAPESINVQLGMLKDKNPGVRYWAARGLSGEPVLTPVLRGAEGAPTVRQVLDKVREAVEAEQDPVVLETLFGLLQSIGTPDATDVLVDQAQKKAVAFDLGQIDQANALRRAVTALQAAYERERRPEAEGKQKIIKAIAQIIIQAPPHGDSLELVEQASDVLSKLSGKASNMAEAIKAYRDQGTLRDSKLIDLIWVEQLGWVQNLELNGQVTVLNWSPQKSADANKETARQ